MEIPDWPLVSILYYFSLNKYSNNTFCSLTGVTVSSFTYLMEYTRISVRPLYSNSMNYCSAISFICVSCKHNSLLFVYFLSIVIYFAVCSFCLYDVSLESSPGKHHRIPNANLEIFNYYHYRSWHSCLYRNVQFT